MKLLTTLALALFVVASTAFAGDACCDKPKAAAATTCEKSCDQAKAGCPVAKAALRKSLTTHKGAQLASK
jgi:hypothetical protein